MRPRLAGLMIVALVPALVAAAPRKKRKSRSKAKAAPVETAPEPAPVPTPTPEPAPTAGSAGSAAAAPVPAPQTPAAGSAAVEPKVPTPEPVDTKPAADEPDVDSLRQEYLSLRDELFKSRARANTVASQLYSTRVQIKLTYASGRYYNPAKSSIRLDGATVFENTTGAIATDDGVRFEGYVAPGRHVVTFRVEATGKDDDSFVSTTESTVVVKAVPNKDLIVSAKAKDNGDIAYEWKKKTQGSYKLGIDVNVKTAARAEDKK